MEWDSMEFNVLSIFISVGRGQVGEPCFAEGSCGDNYAQCINGICLCGETFYEKNGKCRK